jgi:hypothetical protein
MVQIICLANSWKHNGRCIAGIDVNTGKWVRPVSHHPHGEIYEAMWQSLGKEPALLDILEIPLEDRGNYFGFACENRYVSKGQWRLIKQSKIADIWAYRHQESYILHNDRKYVTVPYLQKKDFSERNTLQLVYATKLIITEITSYSSNNQWKGSLITPSNQILKEASITDPVLVGKLEKGYRPENPYLVTVSLGLPYKPKDWKGDEPCWKLIAGVIELQEIDLILVEMERIGWSLENGRKYLKTHYGKVSRSQLSVEEVSQFLNYLKTITSV